MKTSDFSCDEKIYFLLFIDRAYNQTVVEYLVSKFKTVHTPEQHVAIDEELPLWTGRVSFKQYIPCKKARFNIKMFSFFEVSGYLWKSFVYTGKDPFADNDELERYFSSIDIDAIRTVFNFFFFFFFMKKIISI